jgi:isopenicillin N synthase-like dioxygenase
MTTAYRTLPIVDIAGLSSGDAAARLRVARDLGAAARDSGFLYCTGHGVGRDLRARLLGAAKTFFARPHQAKMQVYIGNSTNHSGYVPAGEEVFAGATPDAKEAFDVPLDVPASDPAHGRNAFLGPVQWPDDTAFRADVTAYYAAVASVARRMFAGFALAMDLPEDWFDSRLTKPASQLRLIHYPYNQAAPPDGPGIGAHTDYECFTILLPTAPGLEVLNGAGEWIDVPPIEDAFVVNIGDMLEAMTNGAFVATSHRVRRVKEERYAFPYFAACDYETVIAPLPHFVTAGRPARFSPIVSGDHLLAQTAQTFAYMKKRLADGTMTLPQGALGLSSFGGEARDAPA